MFSKEGIVQRRLICILPKQNMITEKRNNAQDGFNEDLKKKKDLFLVYLASTSSLLWYIFFLSFQ